MTSTIETGKVADIALVPQNSNGDDGKRELLVQLNQVCIYFS